MSFTILKNLEKICEKKISQVIILKSFNLVKLLEMDVNLEKESTKFES
jgi:hypothetical protein